MDYLQNPMSLIFRRSLLLIFLAFFLQSCATSGRNSDIAQQQFLTDIKENNSKLFVFIASFKVAKLDTNDPLMTRPGTGAKQFSQQKRRQSESRELEEKLIEALDEKIAATGYCREGYFVLNQYIHFGSGEIRGECRESATNVDRELFGNQ